MMTTRVSWSSSTTPSSMVSPQRAVQTMGQTTRAVQTIKLLPSERWLYCGKTGSGKSYLARHNLRILSAAGWRVVIVDPEGFWMGQHPKWPTGGAGTVDAPRLVRSFDKKHAVQLYIPRRPAYKDAGLTALCLDAMKQGGCILYFDEIYGVSDHARINEGILEVWTQGRKHNCSGQVSVQRPARIPEFFLSQAENWAVFRTPGEADRKKLGGYSNTPAIRDVLIPPRYWWYWHQEDMDRAQLMRPLATDEPATPGSQKVRTKKEASHG